MAEITITSANFATEVEQATEPVLIDFWATWCGPCKMLAPTIAELSEEYAGKVKVCKVNVDEQPELAARFRVSSIPTVLLFKNGRPENGVVGFVPKEKLEAMLG